MERKKHFYFFRHAQTNENQAGERYGTGIDAWLTDLGIAQAEKLGDYLKDKNIEIVYSSPYKRAIDTAKIAITNNTNVKIITNDALKETMFWFWNTESKEQKQAIQRNFECIRKCLENIIKSDNRKNIAIVSHGGVTRALCWVCGYRVDVIRNAQCFHFVLDDKGWKYIETFISEID